ncbi:RNA-binding protein [Mucilaginibacter sp. ZT4R22]|uniref:RNA-binding protein n=1 Tax=Mucilaginibacter pankratovii TaxID=2772110 RepID=A0ABR7WLA8_9SPHI|nr:RNA-binding protein [Mucilaginibacter pankratovii]MBD1363095.1 RNA-binding protein [Mucilaginibacter pankratovii]
MTKIFLGGFPLTITELDLVQILSYHGEVVTIKIVRDKQTRKCKGYAFIETATLDDANQIIQALNGTMLGERVLTINIVPEENVKSKQQTGPTPYKFTNTSQNKFTRPSANIETAPTRVKRPRIKV